MSEPAAGFAQADDNPARVGEMNFDAAGTGKMVPSLRMRGDNLYPYNEKGTNWGGTTPVGSFRPNALGIGGAIKRVGHVRAALPLDTFLIPDHWSTVVFLRVWW